MAVAEALRMAEVEFKDWELTRRAAPRRKKRAGLCRGGNAFSDGRRKGERERAGSSLHRRFSWM